MNLYHLPRTSRPMLVTDSSPRCSNQDFFAAVFYRLHVVTDRLYFRQVRRLLIAIGKMDCDELIDGMLSCSGGTAEQQRFEVTAGDSLAFPATPDSFFPGEGQGNSVTQ